MQRNLDAFIITNLSEGQSFRKHFSVNQMGGISPQKCGIYKHKKQEYKLVILKSFIRPQYIKTEKQVPLREPDLLIVLTGGEMAYTRKDGVKVIPIGYLKD